MNTRPFPIGMPNPDTHTLTTFDNALKDARNEVLRMASKAEENFKNAINGLLSRNRQLCNEAIAEDDEVNTLERSIDAISFEILMRYNPVAGDLREVLAGMKIANNLERISDEAESIARRAKKMLKHNELAEVHMIEPLFAMAMTLLQESVRAYVEGDSELAVSLYESDKKLDRAHSKAIKELSNAMDEDVANVKPFLHLIFIVRSIERVGDHAVNIAEDGIFAETAADVRHLGQEKAEQVVEEIENA